MRQPPGWRIALLAAFAVAGCAHSATAPRLDGVGRRVLFVGNSYLYSLDIPGIVQALADSAGGDKLAVETVAGPDLALIDHWNDGTALREVKKGGWEWVVLQQGPSSVEVNRDTLRLATKLFAPHIEAVHATTSLFSAWPSAGRRADYPRAIESYALAASDVNGLLLPIASAWQIAWDRHPEIALYSDGLHPSASGAYLSALVIYARFLNKSPKGLPASVRTHGGNVLAVDALVASSLQDIAAEVTGFASPAVR